MQDTINSQAVSVNSRGADIPTNIVPLMSTTSDAVICFTQQQFSGALQAYMINYVISISTVYSLYG